MSTKLLIWVCPNCLRGRRRMLESTGFGCPVEHVCDLCGHPTKSLSPIRMIRHRVEQIQLELIGPIGSP